MSRGVLLAALVLASVLISSGNAAEGVSKLKDLTETLSLLRQPCGAVTSVQTQGKDDHIATCSDGNRYRVYVNAQGREVADKQNKP